MERPKPGASFFTSCVTLCKTIIGSGLLGLPFALAQTGLVLGVALLLLAAAAQGFALHLFALCAIHQRRFGPAGADPPSFHSLAQNARLPPAFVESAVGLATFGARCSFAAAITRHQACDCKCLRVLWPELSWSAFRQPHCAGAGVTGFATSYLIVMGGKRFGWHFDWHLFAYAKPVRVQKVTMEMPRADNAPQIVSSLAGKHAASLPDFWRITVCGITVDLDGPPPLSARYFWITVLGGGVGFPLMFMRSLDALKVSSVVGNIGIMCRPCRAAGT
jgi:hypothetical protein